MWLSSEICRSLFATAGVVYCLLAASAAMAQPPPRRASDEQHIEKPIRAQAALVNVDVFVTNASGDFVAGLERENFRVFDDGVSQEITNFAAIEAPARVLVLVETSPAVYLLHKQHLIAAYALLDGLNPADEVALASYDDFFRIVSSFTRSRAVIRQALGSLSYNWGMAGLKFFDAMSAALDWLAPHPGKKALVLLTTGLDSSGPDRWSALQVRLQSESVVVFAVALGGELRQFRGEKMPDTAAAGSRLSFEEADRALRTMVAMTGGLAFFPNRAEEFAGIYRRIAANLLHQYSLAFVPQQRDGRFHRIAVQVLDDRGRPLPSGGRRGLLVRARAGYFAPQE